MGVSTFFMLVLGIFLLIFKFYSVLYLFMSLEVFLFYLLILFSFFNYNFCYFGLFYGVLGGLFCLLMILNLIKLYGFDLVIF